MPLGRQRLLQRFFNLHHCIATTRAKQKRTATPPRKRLSRPMTSIANGDKRRRASTGANRMTSLRMVTLLTTKNDLVVKTAAIRKIAKRKFPTNAAPDRPRLPRDCPELSESASQGAGPTAVPPARRLCRPGQSGPTNSLARIEQPDSPGQTDRRPSIRIERFASSARTACQLRSTSS